MIPGLKAGVSYKFRVQAVNRYGVGLVSKPTSKYLLGFQLQTLEL